jgi:protein-tyrosine phosphatase
MRERVLDWDGCLNVRDLGGLPTDDGSVTRAGRVVRADSVGQLSDDGWQALADYGIETIVDLRFPRERAEDSPRTAPVDVVHVSLLGEPDEAYWVGLEERTSALGDPEAATTLVYLEFLERHAAETVEAIGAIAAASPGGVVVHCVGGKDRTALVSAFLLRLADVPAEAIAADYALSGEFLAPRHERWIAEARDETERERFRRIAATPAGAMLATLDELERRHGGAAGYLRAAGASDVALAAARARLRD